MVGDTEVGSLPEHWAITSGLSVNRPELRSPEISLPAVFAECVGDYALFDRACLLLWVNHNGVSHGRSSHFSYFLFCCSTPGTFISMMLDQVRAVRLPVEHFSCYGWSGVRWARSHSVGEVPRRWVKTRVRAVALVYPTAVAMSLSELPLRSIVWAMPRRQLVR